MKARKGQACLSPPGICQRERGPPLLPDAQAESGACEPSALTTAPFCMSPRPVNLWTKVWTLQGAGLQLPGAPPPSGPEPEQNCVISAEWPLPYPVPKSLLGLGALYCPFRTS